MRGIRFACLSLAESLLLFSRPLPQHGPSSIICRGYNSAFGNDSTDGTRYTLPDVMPGEDEKLHSLLVRNHLNRDLYESHMHANEVLNRKDDNRLHSSASIGEIPILPSRSLCMPHHTTDAFVSLLEHMNSVNPRPGNSMKMILDSGCGTGVSTRRIYEASSDDVFVVGVDRSESRLGRSYNPVGSENVRIDNASPRLIYVRADLPAIWYLIKSYQIRSQGGIEVVKHCMFYPNPYPKTSRLKNRFYATGALRHMMEIGGPLEVRSNWRLYLEQMDYSWRLWYEMDEQGTSGISSKIEEIDPIITDNVGISNFEQKYFDSGEPVYKLEIC